MHMTMHWIDDKRCSADVRSAIPDAGDVPGMKMRTSLVQDATLQMDFSRVRRTFPEFVDNLKCGSGAAKKLDKNETDDQHGASGKAYHKRVRSRAAQDRAQLRQIELKAALWNSASLHRAETCEDLVEDRNFCRVARNEASDLSHESKNTDLSSVAAFAAEVWSGYDVDSIGGVHVGTIRNELGLHNDFLQRVPSIQDLNAMLGGRDDLGPNIVVVVGAIGEC